MKMEVIECNLMHWFRTLTHVRHRKLLLKRSVGAS